MARLVINNGDTEAEIMNKFSKAIIEDLFFQNGWNEEVGEDYKEEGEDENGK